MCKYRPFELSMYLYSDTLIFNTGIDIDFYRGAFHSDVIYQFFVQLINYINADGKLENLTYVLSQKVLTKSAV